MNTFSLSPKTAHSIQSKNKWRTIHHTNANQSSLFDTYFPLVTKAPQTKCQGPTFLRETKRDNQKNRNTSRSIPKKPNLPDVPNQATTDPITATITTDETNRKPHETEDTKKHRQKQLERNQGRGRGEEAHHVRVLVLIDNPSVLELDVEVLVDGVERAPDGQIILQLHGDFSAHQVLEVGEEQLQKHTTHGASSENISPQH